VETEVGDESSSTYYALKLFSCGNVTKKSKDDVWDRLPVRLSYTCARRGDRQFKMAARILETCRMEEKMCSTWKLKIEVELHLALYFDIAKNSHFKVFR
jgi:hypothetical protein